MSSAEENMGFPFGPVQMLIVGFEEPKFRGEALAELQRLKEADIVRLIDLLVVQKDDSGNITTVQTSDLTVEESTELGAVIGALIGLGTGEEDMVDAGALAGAEAGSDGHLIDAEDVWYVADMIPDGATVAIGLIEHRWAIGLRDAIGRAGGFVLADEWIHPKDLIAVGFKAGEKANA
jgi:uncharacterized membrane protein